MMIGNALETLSMMRWKTYEEIFRSCSRML
jgi:hypothetical protein